MEKMGNKVRKAFRAPKESRDNVAMLAHRENKALPDLAEKKERKENKAIRANKVRKEMKVFLYGCLQTRTGIMYS
jgi:hypothetical protein